MTTPERKARIQWHCRRGMLEVDLLLERFNNAALNTLTDADCDIYERLLVASDPDLLSWLTGNACPIEKEFVDFVAFIQDNYQLKTIN